MAKRKLAFTFVEVVIVIAIIVVLSAIVAFAIGPNAKRQAYLTTNRSNLRQAVLSINVYRADYDDYPPLSLKGLVPETVLYNPETCLPHNYELGIGQVLDMGGIAERFGFEPGTDAAVTCTSCSSHSGKYELRPNPCADGSRRYYRVPLLEAGEKNRVLGARLDGSVAFFEYPPSWYSNMDMSGPEATPK